MDFTSADIRLTPTKAKQFLELNTYEAQRKPSARRVQELADKQRTGKYHTAQIAIGEQNGRKFLLNGQQSCMACVRSGVSVAAHVQTFKCRNSKEIADVFAQFDNGGGRTGTHIAYPFAIAAGLGQYKPTIINLCASALTIADLGTKPHNVKGETKESRAERILTPANKPTVEFIGNLVQPRDGKHIRRVPCCGVHGHAPPNQQGRRASVLAAGPRRDELRRQRRSEEGAARLAAGGAERRRNASARRKRFGP